MNHCTNIQSGQIVVIDGNINIKVEKWELKSGLIDITCSTAGYILIGEDNLTAVTVGSNFGFKNISTNEHVGIRVSAMTEETLTLCFTTEEKSVKVLDLYDQAI
ncbi:hypothetical protein MK079_01020 [Candidatus Gracilibacteria bacterium]|nr:hypothetical protein [Candidatus Gracilibacteria bacterium]